MKSLLVVEDEKMIRQGIVTMIRRSPVMVEEILECRNGEEALEILHSRQIDVMFTDIRMPKMDGIALIGHLESLPNPPKTIVVSGYDDFSYAVEAMRGGVLDYLLKPIEREKLYELLEKLETELKADEQKHKRELEIGRKELRYLLLNPQVPQEELAEMEQRFFSEKYRVCICSDLPEIENSGSVQLCGLDGQTVFLVKEGGLEELTERILAGHCLGISRAYQGVRLLWEAYGEALAARKRAFVTGKHAVFYENPAVNDEKEQEEIPDTFPEQFVHLFGTEKIQTGMNRLENYYFMAKHGSVDEERILDVTREILDKILTTYKNVIELDMDGYLGLKQPLAFESAAGFMERFKDWAYRTNQRLTEEFEDYRNKGKISQAVAYIHENYDKELNMAVVSNHISMNYSLFSLSFKQYTGMNFVNYLKMIRIREAKRLLEETDEKIIDISQKVGYENEKHFMKTFKSVCGVSPSEYRRNVQMGRPKE
ncbi:MAG: response regulator [Eubacteriales bacterium]|nr:response regulator [Eubacteriales bacterium]